MDIDELIAKLSSGEMTQEEFQKRLNEMIESAGKEARRSSVAKAEQFAKTVRSLREEVKQEAEDRRPPTLSVPEESVAEQRIKTAAKIARSI